MLRDMPHLMIGPGCGINQGIDGRRFSWGWLIPIHIVRTPNSGGSEEIWPFRGDVRHRSRKWKAIFAKRRRLAESMPMRRFEFIGEYDEERPQDWTHPFDPFTDRHYAAVYCGRHYGRRKGINDQRQYQYFGIFRICRRFAGPRHQFRLTQDQNSYRMSHPDEFWKSLPGTVGMKNAISVIDTSQSMMAYGAHTLADSLGLFYAEHAKGTFHNKFITFSEKPKLMKVCSDRLDLKLMKIHNAGWGGTTNLEKVYNMLLRMAVRAGAGQDEMPSAVVIYSDMEFNRSVTNPDESLFDACREAVEQAGYEMPAIVFHHVNSLQMQTPVLSGEQGTALSSGRTTHHMKHRHEHSTTPLLHMLEVLMSERYAPIHA